jgi:hypothetical protein
MADGVLCRGTNLQKRDGFVAERCQPSRRRAIFLKPLNNQQMINFLPANYDGMSS